MPNDGAQRRRIVEMRWRGHNRAVLAARFAPPTLPPNWGASLANRPRYVGDAPVDAAVPTDIFALADSEATLSERLLHVLRGFAARGEMLPPDDVLEEILDVRKQQLRRALLELAKGGQIRVWHNNRSRILQLTETGEELRSRFAPAGIKPWGP